MIPFDDPRWTRLRCALGCQCNQRELIRSISDGAITTDVWDMAFNHIVYQDEIDELSLAAGPYQVDAIERSTKLRWEPLSLLAATEIATTNRVDFPSDLLSDFKTAFSRIPNLLAKHCDRSWDELVTRCATSCIALACGHRGLAKIYLECSYDDLCRCRETLEQ